MQSAEAIASTFLEDYHGYEIHIDEIGAVAYMEGKPAARSTDVLTLKTILDIIIQEEQRHTEEYK